VAHAALDSAWATFTTNVDPILAAAVDSAINKPTFDGWWSSVYSAITDLAGVVSRQAQSTGNTAQTGVNTINDPDTLTTGEKPQIILDYNAITGENADLVAKANAYSVNHSTYDTAYSALLSYLGTLTSPTAWNSLSGTTALGTGNRVALWNPKWTDVKNAAADLRNAIAVGTAQSAITTAAQDATNKANAAQLASQPHQVAWAYASKPALPNALYPAGYYAITTDSRTVQVNEAGTAWTDVLVAATGLFGKLFADQLTVTNFDNLIPNGNSEMDLTGMPPGSIEGAGVATGYAYSGTRTRRITTAGTGMNWLYVSPMIPVSQDDAIYFEAMTGCDSPAVRTIAIDIFDASGSWVNGFYAVNRASDGDLSGSASTVYKKQIVQGVIPSGACFIRALVGAQNTSGDARNAQFDSLYMRRMADASLLVDGVLQALVARVPLLYSLDMRSGSDASGYQAGTAIAAPIGFRISANQFSTTYIGGTTDLTCQMELGGSANFGGYRVSTVADRAMNRFTEFTSGSGNWVCPIGVYLVEVTLVGAGAGGGKSNTSVGGGGGGAGACINYLLRTTPGASYAYSVGSGGAGAVSDSTAGAVGTGTSFNGVTASGGGTNGASGGGGGGSVSGPGGAAGIGGGAIASGYVGSSASGGGTSAQVFSILGGGGGSGGKSTFYATGGASGAVPGLAGTGSVASGNGGSSGWSQGSAGVDNGTPSQPGYGGGGGGTKTGAAGGRGGDGYILLMY
jgi:hypothetical protein